MLQEEIAKVWRVPHLQGLELLQATLTTHSFPKHFHESYGIGLGDRGSGVIYCQGTKYIAPPQHLIFFHPGEVHSGYANEQNPWTYRMIYLDVSVINQVIENYGQIISFPQTTFSNRSIANLFDCTHQLFSQSASKLEHDESLQNFVKRLIKQASIIPKTSSNSQEHKAIKLIREYLEENYQENVSLERLCSLTGWSPSYLVTTFRQKLGIPPHSYQMQVRVQRAKKHLLTNKPLVKVALDVGFFDQSHLTRCFKRVMGVTPGAYRNSNFS